MTTHSASDDAASSATDATESADVADAEAEVVDGEDQTDVQAADDNETNETDTNGDETVPHVELDLYQLSVRVSGQSTDSLEDVEGSAKELMSFLIRQARQLEDEPDTRGLS